MSIHPATTTASAGLDFVTHTLVRPEYWTNLVSGMSISTNGGPKIQPVQLGEECIRETYASVIREGYFNLDAVFDVSRIQTMAGVVKSLVKASCPPVFAFVFDEFWKTCGQLSSLLQALLGKQYCQLPDFWAWHVDPANESSGWRPHRDKGFGALNPDGSPKSFTVWIPLTEATPLNGCMYVVPAHLDPPSRYQNEEDRRMPANLQDVRALPAKPGAVLGWNQSILHWGARSSRRATEPRISFACEFQRGDIEPYNRPLLDPVQPPPFELRLALIGKQILQYRHMYGLSESMGVIASRLQSLAALR